jgi:hypothetical protein
LIPKFTHLFGIRKKDAQAKAEEPVSAIIDP